MSEKNSTTHREALKKMGLSEKEEKRGKMKVLAINGSSRKDGNTADMLNLVLGELEKEGYETEHIQLAGHTINPLQSLFRLCRKEKLRVRQ